jgi:hypothetical protein
MNVGAFLDALEEDVLLPLRKTQKLFRDHETVTRLYTTLSPEEMTIDPAFDTNPELPEVDNVHVADRVMSCDQVGWTLTLPQGHTIEGSGGDWPVPERASVLPYNLRTLQLSARGDGEVVIDNHDTVTDALVELGVSPEPKKSSGFCAVRRQPGDRAYPFGVIGVLLGTGLLLRRRQHRRR